MFYIIETKEQLSRLQSSESCYIEVIAGSDNYHPHLTYPSLIYYRSKYKGYIFGIRHSETFSLSIEDVQSFISNCKTVYCQDQKYTSYFLQHPNFVDLNQVAVDLENKHIDHECNTKLHTDYYHQHSYLPDINYLIPVSKHYERCECLYEKLAPYIGKETNQDFYRELSEQYRIVETRGLGVDDSLFMKYYEPTWRPFSTADNRVYTYYNLYNLTGRPTNAFNGINFLALNKEDNSRKAFIPVNDMFLEFDFDGYHLRLIANMLNYEFDIKTSIHTQLGKQYFQKEILTEEEYKESKAITFRQIYGGIQKEYKHIPFFQKVEAFIDNLWDTYQYGGYIKLPTGRDLYLSKNSLNPQKLFNYYIQNLETYQNVSILKKLNKLLEEKKSKIVLIVYDSFLLDFALEDGKELLLEVKEIIEREGFTAKVKIGKDYSSLTKTNYL